MPRPQRGGRRATQEIFDDITIRERALGYRRLAVPGGRHG
ncbi:hypothetical protein FRAHR75_10166 [Frankia sp. Hr75.2]|nr:hypothetical protein FRAHR75_10166 [Frankia sp. Hr75.2]SQD96565.1 hypothetical protein FMEAI12_3650028 [Parafrankia sp. Ea1.12]